MADFIGEVERDAITELVNIAIGHAAASLATLVEDEVRLSVPVIAFLSPEEAARRLDVETHSGETVAVRQHFSGRMSGDILLIFPERRSLELVRSMLGREIPLEQLTELEQEALLEVGNIILNACLGSIANQLGLSLESSLPSYLHGRGLHILDIAGRRGGGEDLVLFLHVDFALLKKDINGYVAFVMDILSARNFIEAVNSNLAARLAG